ncbi:MAG: ATPase [Gammaproteobacteria bacterium]
MTQSNPMNIPPVSISAAKHALAAQFDHPVLRRRATMLWGTRGIGKSSVVRQVADAAGVTLIDLRLTTIEPVDLRGAIYADDEREQTVWFPPEFLPSDPASSGILFLDELTAADQRLQISAYSLILDRRVGNYCLPDGWMVVAAGNASFHGAVSYDMGTALADRMFHFNIEPTVEAFLDYALERDFAPEVLAYLKVRADRLDDTEAQIAADHLVGASPRGWEDVSEVLQAEIDDAQRRLFVQGRIGAANAAEFFGVLRELRSAVDVQALLAATPGEATRVLLPTSLDGLYGMIYGLVAAVDSESRMRRALDIVGQYPDFDPTAGLPASEAQTLTFELLFRRALERGLDASVLDHPVYLEYSAKRDAMTDR